MEIERKWRIPRIPKVILDTCKANRIVQGYLVIDDEGEVRIRIDESGFTLTFKSGGTISRQEENYKLQSSLGYDLLRRRMVGERIVKDRYTFATEKWGTIEFDHYTAFLDGLAIVEVEFPDIQTAHAFVLPEWIEGAKDVTADKRYKNKNLALRAAKVREELGFC